MRILKLSLYVKNNNNINNLFQIKISAEKKIFCGDFLHNYYVKTLKFRLSTIAQIEKLFWLN